MSDYELSVETLQYVGGGSNKFYRAALIKDGSSYWSVCQWGSQRSGRTGGQAAVKVGGSMYYDKLQEKRAEGYQPIQPESGTWTIKDGTTEHTNLANAFRNKDGKAAAATIERVMGGASAPRGTAPSTVTCNDCGAIFNSRPELQTHMARTHASQGSSGTQTQVVEKDSLSVLAERALSALSTAATDPTAALVERASIVTALKEEQKKIDRVQSYLDSLDLMIDDELV